jgi:restriction endonuclease S subunit
LEYLLAICQTPQMIENIQREATGTGVQHIKIEDVGNFPVPIPSLEEQKKAIEELNNIRKMIKNSEENMRTLKNRLSLSLL